MKKNLTKLFAIAFGLSIGAIPIFAQNENPEITFHFRGADIESVLDYLSEAAGFIIVMETKVEGKIHAWSKQPISANEAVALLDTLLADKGYAVVRNHRILKIVDRNDARQYNLPVRRGADPAQIPKDDSMVTQIIPVRYADAVQLIEDLEPLLTEDATLTANQSSNALVLTDRQASIHRIAEIITALDTSISSISTIRIFPLQYADAETLAKVIDDIFQQPETNSRSRGSSRSALARFGFEDRSRSSSRTSSRSSGSSEARQAASHVVAVADTRTHSLVVSAPDEYIPAIEEIVSQVDRAVEDITEIAVFHLEHADAQETAQILNDLFEEQEEGNDARSGGRGFFGRGGFPGFPSSRESRNRRDNSESNARLLQQQSIVAVADARTNSVIVSASAGLMQQISKMIKQLDSDRSRKQKVYVYSLEHADADNVAEILRGMFEDRLNAASRNATRQNNERNNPLNNRTVTTQGFGTRSN